MINRTLITLLSAVTISLTTPIYATEQEATEREPKPADSAKETKSKDNKKKPTKIYAIKDRFGNIVGYTDTPKKGAEEVKIQKGTEYSSTNSTEYTPDNSPTKWENATPKEVKEEPLYTHLAIASPSSEATLRNSSGSFQVAVDVRPRLQTGHVVQLLVDGVPSGSPGSVILSANNVGPGTHALVVQVQAVDGQIVKRSPPVTVHLQ